jgi:hypothetical protein
MSAANRDDFIVSLMRSGMSSLAFATWRRIWWKGVVEDVVRLAGSKAQAANVLGIHRTSIARILASKE